MTGKQLRNSILQWAIQGKLVPQDPNDEPASVLLERIRAEKARLVKEKKIKRDKNETIIYRGEDNSYYEKTLATGAVRCIDDEIPFDIPRSWTWCRLGSVFNIWSARRVHEKDWRSKGIPFYRAREIAKLADFGTVDNDLFITKELYEEFSKSGIPHIGDLMITAVGTLGKTYIVDTNEPFYYKDGSVLCIGNPYGFYSKYLKAFFESTIFSDQYLSESDGTTVATLTMVRLNKYLIPLPPLKEQVRIMNKVSSLLSLTDVYTIKHNQFEKLNTQIAELLKKSVLQEAIQGRLVPQIESEGTADELLEEIRAEKKRLVKEGKMKKSVIANESYIFRGDDNKYYEQIGSKRFDISDKIPFEIPQSWQWCRLSNVIILLSGRDLEPSQYNDKGSGFPYITGASNFSNGNLIINRWTESPVTISKKGELLITCKGTIGTMAINTVGPIHIARQVMSMSSYINPLFLRDFLKLKIPFLVKKAKSMIPGISRDDIENLLIPIPPITEQGRIVSRINNLSNLII